MPEEELAAIWPGGERNETRGPEAWLYTHWNLARFFARHEARQEYTDGAHAGRSDALLALQGGEPKMVTLSQPMVMDGVEVHEVRLAHKSFPALRRMASYARVATQLLGYLRTLEAHPEHTDLVLEAHGWRERVLLMLIWGATADGPGLPWDTRTAPWPTLPGWLETLPVADVLAIHHAWAEQHGRALLALQPFLTGGDGEKDPLSGWETFFASYATEKGIDVERLLHDRAFAPFLTQVTLAAHASRAAREQAEAERTHGA